MKRFFVCALTAAIFTCTAMAGVITQVATRGALGANDSIDWSGLGPSFTSVSNPFNFSTTGGNTFTGDKDTAGNMERRDQGSSWSGNFAPGDALLWTTAGAPGRITLTFTTPISAIGAQIQADFFGAFTGTLEAFNGATLMGSVNVAGNSNTNGDNSAVFLGLSSSARDITSVRFSVPVASSNPNDFAINRVDINGQSVPEPATSALLGAGLIGLGFRRKLLAR